LEESLTLAELTEVYKSIALRDWETHRAVFGAAGVDLPNPFKESEEHLTVDDIRRRALGDTHNDVVDMSIEFGPDSPQFGYEVENN